MSRPRLNAHEVAEIRVGLLSPDPSYRTQALAKFASTLPKALVDGNAFVDALKDGHVAGNCVDEAVQYVDVLLGQRTLCPGVELAGMFFNALNRAHEQEKEIAELKTKTHYMVAFKRDPRLMRKKKTTEAMELQKQNRELKKQLKEEKDAREFIKEEYFDMVADYKGRVQFSKMPYVEELGLRDEQLARARKKIRELEDELARVRALEKANKQCQTEKMATTYDDEDAIVYDSDSDEVGGSEDEEEDVVQYRKDEAAECHPGIVVVPRVDKHRQFKMGYSVSEATYSLGVKKRLGVFDSLAYKVDGIVMKRANDDMYLLALEDGRETGEISWRIDLCGLDVDFVVVRLLGITKYENGEIRATVTCGGRRHNAETDELVTFHDLGFVDFLDIKVTFKGEGGRGGDVAWQHAEHFSSPIGNPMADMFLALELK